MKLTDLYENEIETLTYAQWKKRILDKFPDTIFKNDGGVGGAYAESIEAVSPRIAKIKQKPISSTNREGESDGPGRRGLYPVDGKGGCSINEMDKSGEVEMLEFESSGPADPKDAK